MKHLLSFLILLVLVISIVGSIVAFDEPPNATWTVCASGCDFSTIASAIADVQVNPGDTLDLADETYPEHDILLNKDLVLMGEGQQITIIDAMSLGRVLSITQGTEVTIHNLTLTGGSIGGSGSVVYGGGINNHGSLSLYNVGVEFNTALSYSCGGGIYNDLESTLLISNSRLYQNSTPSHASGRGGALCNNGKATLERTIVKDNIAFFSGAISNNGTMTITQTIIEGNKGSISIFSNLENGIVNIDRSVLFSNLWGYIIENVGQITIVNTTMSDNDDGIGNGGSMKISFSTIAHNNGRGIVLADTLLLENSIIAQNARGDCGQILPVNITSLGGNLSGDNSCELNHPSDLSNIDPGLAILGDYGGDTMTHALLTTSPAIDAAVNCATIIEDQRGFPRPIGAACDIGAYEGIVPFSSYSFLPVTLK